MEQVPSTGPLASLVSVDPERLGGEPVFRGTRVPIRALFEYLAAGHALDTFLDHFEGVPREQAQALIELAADGLLGAVVGARAA